MNNKTADILTRLTEKVKRANSIQHSGGKILAEDWSELYMLANEADAALADPPATAPPDDGLQEFTVRISGTAPAWADVKVRAATAEEAYRMVNEGEVPNLEELSSDSHEWEFCEGGNGIDDWSVTGDVSDAEGNELMVDGEWQEEEEDDEESEDSPRVSPGA